MHTMETPFYAANMMKPKPVQITWFISYLINMHYIIIYTSTIFDPEISMGICIHSNEFEIRISNQDSENINTLSIPVRMMKYEV